MSHIYTDLPYAFRTHLKTDRENIHTLVLLVPFKLMLRSLSISNIVLPQLLHYLPSQVIICKAKLHIN